MRRPGEGAHYSRKVRAGCTSVYHPPTVQPCAEHGPKTCPRREIPRANITRKACVDATFAGHYVDAPLTDLLAEPDVLAVIGFGLSSPTTADPRYLHIGLEHAGSERHEVWRGVAPVKSGVVGKVRWSCDNTYLFFSVAIDEGEAGGIEAAAELAYAHVCSLLEQRPFEDGSRAHILRLWNYMDAINEGEGDDERYRQFCSGRARGITPATRNG